MKIKILLSLTDVYLAILDRIAQTARKMAETQDSRHEIGYRPAAMRAILDLVKDADPVKLLKGEYRLVKK